MSPPGLLRPVIAALLAAPLAGAIAQVTPPIAATVTPFSPYLGERVGIDAWSERCSGPMFDAAHAPTIEQLAHTPGTGGPQQDEYTYELVYHMIYPELCLATPPPAMYSNVIDLGDDLPQGHHTVHVKGVTPDDELQVAYDVQFYVGPVDGLREDVSGMWFAPEQSGRGLTVALRGNTAVLYWATHDADGDSAWNILTTPLAAVDDRHIVEGTALATRGAPLAAGAAELEVEEWGDVRFEYRGCGKATWSWDAIDPAIGDGELDMVQVLQPDGVYACDVATLPNRVEATWIE